MRRWPSWGPCRARKRWASFAAPPQASRPCSDGKWRQTQTSRRRQQLVPWRSTRPSPRCSRRTRRRRSPRTAAHPSPRGPTARNSGAARHRRRCYFRAMSLRSVARGRVPTARGVAVRTARGLPVARKVRGRALPLGTAGAAPLMEPHWRLVKRSASRTGRGARCLLQRCTPCRPSPVPAMRKRLGLLTPRGLPSVPARLGLLEGGAAALATARCVESREEKTTGDTTVE
mmetsp:Transcript_29379/g.63149  ORF Transcript_29379/g.63149 Transcript_29379/m.63149 type:complete len:230 (+) Transcript_29379:211-900(+)